MGMHCHAVAELKRTRARGGVYRVFNGTLTRGRAGPLAHMHGSLLAGGDVAATAPGDNQGERNRAARQWGVATTTTRWCDAATTNTRNNHDTQTRGRTQPEGVATTTRRNAYAQPAEALRVVATGGASHASDAGQPCKRDILTRASRRGTMRNRQQQETTP
jgi:hypothetical protein